MAGPRWTFYDATTATTYEFQVNPNEGGSPKFEKQINYQATAAPDGKLLVFEGRDSPQEIEFSGTLLDQDQYEDFIEWFNKRHQVLLTDDLGRQYWVYIKSFVPKRERAVHYPYKHSYSISAVILDWA